MATARGDILQGTLDMLVLKALQLEPMHGWGITERIEQWSESVLQLGQGTLYPALYRLERQGLIRSEWNITENNRRARYYALTREGRSQLNDELAQSRRMASNLVDDLAASRNRQPARRGDAVPSRSADAKAPACRDDAGGSAPAGARKVWRSGAREGRGARGGSADAD